MFDDQDVTLAQFLMPETVEQQPRDRVAGLDVGFQGKGNDAEFPGGEKRTFLSPFWGFVVPLRRPTAYAVGYILAPLRGCSLPGDLLLTHWQLQGDRPVAIAGPGAGRGFRRARRQGYVNPRDGRHPARCPAEKALRRVSRCLEGPHGEVRTYRGRNGRETMRPGVARARLNNVRPPSAAGRRRRPARIAESFPVPSAGSGGCRLE